MNMSSIANLAYAAGVKTQSDLQACVAIAMAESGGDEKNVGDKDKVGRPTNDGRHWGASYGLWQIRSVQEESGKGTIRDGTRLTDPTFNAASMLSISHGGKNWGAWSTWPLAAGPFLPLAASAAAGAIAGGGKDIVVDGAKDTAQAVDNVNVAVKATYDWISNRNNVMRVAKVSIGVILLAGAVYAVANPAGRILKTEVGKAVAGTASVGGKVKSAAKYVGKGAQ